MLNVVDEFTRECLAIRVGRKLKAPTSSTCWRTCSSSRGMPGAHPLGQRSGVRGHGGKGLDHRRAASTAFIEPGSPWENGYVESFNGKLRDELLNTEVFNSLAEAKVLIEQWRRHYNTVRPHSSLGYRPPRAGGGDDGVAHAAQPARANRISPSQDSHALTFRPDHLVGAGHRYKR